jgi:hypothetical protein
MPFGGRQAASNVHFSRDENCLFLQRRTNHKQPSKGQVTNMQDKKRKTKKGVKVDDLKPAKDPKGGGMPQGFPPDLKSLLKHLQLGQGPGR